MKESTREFLQDLRKQFHDDRIPDDYMSKIAERMTIEEGYKKAAEAARAEKEAREEMYNRGEAPEAEGAAAAKALKEVLLPQIKEQIAGTIARETAIADKLNRIGRSQEGREQVERLLEITRERQDYINGRIKDAEAQGNEALLNEYTQEKADVEKDLEIYLSKYEQFKAEAEG